MAVRTKTSRFSTNSFSYWPIMFVLMVMMLVKMGAAQDNTSCLNSLVPCASYLNATTKPPDSCCVPLLNVIRTQAQCLCSLLNSSLVQQSGINITQVLNVPRLCGDTNVTTSSCSNVSATAPSASITPSGTTPPSGPAESGDSNSIGATFLQILFPLLGGLFLGVFKSFP